MLAALSHPNIAAIYGLEVLDSPADPRSPSCSSWSTAKRSPSACSEDGCRSRTRWRLARQIAEGVEAAHHRGIVHRDLKPANIKITATTARSRCWTSGSRSWHIRTRTGAAQDAALSPTITSPALRDRRTVLLGTAAYMSPEQAKGREADKRSDVWAFGCVLFEMLAGRRPFHGDDIPDVLGAIVRLEPAWQALPAELPIAVRRLLEGCLEKDPLRRIGDLVRREVPARERSQPRRRLRPCLSRLVVAPRGPGATAALAHHRGNRRCGSWYALAPRPAAPAITPIRRLRRRATLPCRSIS